MAYGKTTFGRRFLTSKNPPDQIKSNDSSFPTPSKASECAIANAVAKAFDDAEVLAQHGPVRVLMKDGKRLA